MIQTLFDLLLIGLLVVTAWRTTASPDLFGCIVAFISFGLIMAITWMRLGAPDVALAEAAVGAGLTGALLLSALGRMHKASLSDEKEDEA